MRKWLLGAAVGAIAGVLMIGAAKRATGPIEFVVAEMGQPTHGDSYILPLTDPTDIRHARDLIRYGGMTHIAVCEIAAGADGINRDVLAPGEPLWSWHVTGFLGFADTTAEVLDGWPGHVEQAPGAYIGPDGTGMIGFWGYTVTQELGPGPGFNPPTAPNGLSVSAPGGGRANVTWTDRSSNEDGFEVERQQQVNRFWTNDTLITTGPNTSSYADTPGAGTFQYRVRSFNAAGSSTWTGWKKVTVR